MRITAIRTRQVDVPLPAPFFPAWAPGSSVDRIRLAYVRIETDAGLFGVAGHEFFGAEEQCVQRVAQHLVGTDPLRLEQHAGMLRSLWPYFGASVWFVELALWDHPGQGRGPAGLPSSREFPRRGPRLRLDRAGSVAGPACGRLPPAPRRGVPGGEAPHPRRCPRRRRGPGAGGAKGRRRRSRHHGGRQPGRRRRLGDARAPVELPPRAPDGPGPGRARRRLARGAAAPPRLRRLAAAPRRRRRSPSRGARTTSSSTTWCGSSAMGASTCSSPT